MKKTFHLMLLVFAALFLASCQGETSKENLLLADPTIFYWDGVYYAYGTGGVDNHTADGFLVYTSTDLQQWEGPAGATDGFALKKGDSYGTQGFWAPQVFHYRDKFYMAYTANEQIAIASADSPLGPFRQDELKPVSDVCKQIDPYVFFDEDGKIYLYHVRLLEGNRLFVTEISDTFDALDESTLTECVASEPGTWEDTWNAEWRVAEGPTILKDGGRYYFFYSSNDFRNPDYAVGYAVADSPLGPWAKYGGNPVIDRHLLGYNGTGHGDVFRDGAGSMYYVFHTHQSDSVVAPRRTALIRMEKADGAFRVLPETLRFLER